MEIDSFPKFWESLLFHLNVSHVTSLDQPCSKYLKTLAMKNTNFYKIAWSFYILLLLDFLNFDHDIEISTFFYSPKTGILLNLMKKNYFFLHSLKTQIPGHFINKSKLSLQKSYQHWSLEQKWKGKTNQQADEINKWNQSTLPVSRKYTE